MAPLSGGTGKFQRCTAPAMQAETEGIPRVSLVGAAVITEPLELMTKRTATRPASPGLLARPCS